jgi:hypothetical protein
VAVSTPGSTSTPGGGKVKGVAALTVACDRAVNERINCNRVVPDGLRRFCEDNLTPIHGLD